MIRIALAVALVSVPLAVVAAQSEGSPRWAANLVRKQQVIMHGVPAPYGTMRDRSPDTPAKLARGRALFDRNCAACHGWSGEGTGPEAFAQVPAPADLEWLEHTPEARAEPYLYWSIAEGGKAFDSEMPAFKKSMSRKDIWAVVAYLRAGLPRKAP